MASKWPLYIKYARELRKKQTPEEKILWAYLRNRKFYGYKFLRQHPILLPTLTDHQQFYIADFFCDAKKLVVEVDGLIHTLYVDADAARDILFLEMNLSVLRVTNEEVNTNVDRVLKKIEKFL